MYRSLGEVNAGSLSDFPSLKVEANSDITSRGLQESTNSQISRDRKRRLEESRLWELIWHYSGTQWKAHLSISICNLLSSCPWSGKSSEKRSVCTDAEIGGCGGKVKSLRQNFCITDSGERISIIVQRRRRDWIQFCLLEGGIFIRRNWTLFFYTRIWRKYRKKKKFWKLENEIEADPSTQRLRKNCCTLIFKDSHILWHSVDSTTGAKTQRIAGSKFAQAGNSRVWSELKQTESG